MKCCRFALILFLAIIAVASSHVASAQTGIYANFSVAKFNVANTGRLYGPTFGAYFDAGHLGFFSTGVDIRGSFLSDGGQTQLDSGLVGPRLAVHPRVLPINPYVEILGGVGHVKFGQGSAQTTSTNFEYQALGGVDVTILPRLDWRVIEFSYDGVPSLYGGFHPKTISTGLVFRLP